MHEVSFLVASLEMLEPRRPLYIVGLQGNEEWGADERRGARERVEGLERCERIVCDVNAVVKRSNNDKQE